MTVKLDVLAEVADEQCWASSPLRATGDPAFDPSSWNCTVPAGGAVPATGQTVPVKATDWPTVPS